MSEWSQGFIACFILLVLIYLTPFALRSILRMLGRVLGIGVLSVSGYRCTRCNHIVVDRDDTGIHFYLGERRMLHMHLPCMWKMLEESIGRDRLDEMAEIFKSGECDHE